MTTTKFYEECDACEGSGGVHEYCCRGYDEIGNPDCGCHGRGTVEDCRHCDGTGRIATDEIVWDFDTLDEVDRHDYQVFYAIQGVGRKGAYTGTAVYTHGAYDTIEDVEPA